MACSQQPQRRSSHTSSRIKRENTVLAGVLRNPKAVPPLSAARNAQTMLLRRLQRRILHHCSMASDNNGHEGSSTDCRSCNELRCDFEVAAPKGAIRERDDWSRRGQRTMNEEIFNAHSQLCIGLVGSARSARRRACEELLRALHVFGWKRRRQPERQPAGGQERAISRKAISTARLRLAGRALGCYGGNERRGCGTVFKLAPNGVETVLHAFTGGSDGYEPQSGLIMDKSGNLYGTTLHGGGGCGRDGCGTVFKVAPNGCSETVLYAFKAEVTAPIRSPDWLPTRTAIYTALLPLAAGTHTCGNLGAQQSAGCGIVFKIAPNGTETVLHVFTGGSDGGAPGASLIIDKAGNLYGTTGANGTADSCDHELYGCGTVFKIAPNGTETLLHVFTGGGDGGAPAASLTIDDAGNLYGTTVGGGSADDCGYGSVFSGCGTVFKLAPNGTETVLHVFTGGSDGAYPIGGLIADSAGNLYGTTGGGGSKEKLQSWTLWLRHRLQTRNGRHRNRAPHFFRQEGGWRIPRRQSDRGQEGRSLRHDLQGWREGTTWLWNGLHCC